MNDRSEVDFINGWAYASRASSHRHALPTPIDLGDREAALCNQQPVFGWVEDSSARDKFYCHSCLVRLGNMYADDDPRLTTADRVRWRAVEKELSNPVRITDENLQPSRTSESPS